MKIYYGDGNKYADITEMALSLCTLNKVLNIPDEDNARANIFGDPIFGKLKHIKIIQDDIESIYDHNTPISIKLKDDIEIPKIAKVKVNQEINDPSNRLADLHSRLRIHYGCKTDEYPEQFMTICYLNPKDIVLELGGNIGRNTCVIASILDDDKNLVSLESSSVSALQLSYNRMCNGYQFNIENSALSSVPLVQCGWTTKVSDVDVEGYFRIKTITFKELENKYGLKFNTLVADCEGALYQILKDTPEMLEGIEKIIIENDFNYMDEKNFIDRIFESYGFVCVYSKDGGWGPCSPFFYQVFKKVIDL